MSTANMSAIPPLPLNCFYFVDTPKALRERDGKRANELNPKRRRVRSKRGYRMASAKRCRCACQAAPLAPKERLAVLQWFYAEAAKEGIELSPFDANEEAA